MSKAAKTQLINLIETLQRANLSLEKLLGSKKQEELFALLAECQECAITIGTKIEQICGEGTRSVSELEAYCETLYQIVQNLDAVEGYRKLWKTSQKQLEIAKDEMEIELPQKKEIVFLPYKASMWDSLESVWRAAEDDSECEAYVIPIPYYDRNQDGSFREEHYEGDLFPAYVPIIQYDEYDFELRRPDVIFIHNPYDGANVVTSVHPYFYSKNLKQFTDKLVYIPYFMLNGITYGNKESVDSMKHFPMTPAVIHANKVIVQSEEMRRIYIEVLTEETNAELRGYWEKKILGLQLLWI